MKLFIALFLSISISLIGNSQNESNRTIESITYRAQIGNTVGLIKLSDGSVWKWMPDMYSTNLLQGWSEGDEILISTANQPGFILQNLSKPRYAPIVALSFNSYSLFPHIAHLSEDETVLELSNGSRWQLLYDFNVRTLHYWTVGDRIVPVKGIKDNFELINLDIPHANRCLIERSIQVAQLEVEELTLFLEEKISAVNVEEETND